MLSIPIGYVAREHVETRQHADASSQSPFAAKCPQRTFESVISTIWKVRQRQDIFFFLLPISH